MKSQKYAGWEIEKTTINLTEEAYFMSRPDWEAKGIRYAIMVFKNSASEWAAEHMVWSNKYEEYTYVHTDKQVVGPVPMVVKEIEKRAAYWMSKR